MFAVVVVVVVVVVVGWWKNGNVKKGLMEKWQCQKKMSSVKTNKNKYLVVIVDVKDISLTNNNNLLNVKDFIRIRWFVFTVNGCAMYTLLQDKFVCAL